MLNKSVVCFQEWVLNKSVVCFQEWVLNKSVVCFQEWALNKSVVCFQEWALNKSVVCFQEWALNKSVVCFQEWALNKSVVCFQEWVLRNQETLLEVVWACCQTPAVLSPAASPASPTSPIHPGSQRLSALSSSLLLPTMSEAAARTLGCALVEVVTMDTLYNDVTWPDPEFSKVTLERYIALLDSFSRLRGEKRKIKINEKGGKFGYLVNGAHCLSLVQFNSVQLKAVSMHSGKPICTLPLLLEVSPALPLKHHSVCCCCKHNLHLKGFLFWSVTCSLYGGGYECDTNVVPFLCFRQLYL